MVTNFPTGDQTYYISIDERNAYVLEKAYGTIVSEHPRQWGVERIATCASQLLCRRELPEADIDQSSSKNFASLREAYGEPSGDRCPHRGYDLRSVPIASDGCRQCPLHQLRVRAPHGTMKGAIRVASAGDTGIARGVTGFSISRQKRSKEIEDHPLLEREQHRLPGRTTSYASRAHRKERPAAAASAPTRAER